MRVSIGYVARLFIIMITMLLSIFLTMFPNGLKQYLNNRYNNILYILDFKFVIKLMEVISPKLFLDIPNYLVVYMSIAPLIFALTLLFTKGKVVVISATLILISVLLVHLPVSIEIRDHQSINLKSCRIIFAAIVIYFVIILSLSEYGKDQKNNIYVDKTIQVKCIANPVPSRLENKIFEEKTKKIQTN